jgi:(4-alkanoyl-5-oxo-2,5-dihydrofuran-3-yl)methyl phosphate reductase
MIFITGITGNVGGELARLLVESGQRVRGLTRDPSKARASLSNVELVRGDIAQPSSYAPHLAGVEQAFFMTESGAQMADHATQFCDEARRAGVRHVVALSSGTIAIEKASAIGRWHHALEDAVNASNISATFLRPGNFASNALRWAGMIRSQGAVFHPYPDGRSAPIDPRDIAAAAFVALGDPARRGQTLQLTGPAKLSTRDQVQTIATALAREIRVVEVPEVGARKGMLGSGMSETMADAILELARASANDIEPLSPAVRDLTGREPRTFAAWTHDHIDAFR